MQTLLILYSKMAPVKVALSLPSHMAVAKLNPTRTEGMQFTVDATVNALYDDLVKTCSSF